jgi:hypothetical protein
MPTLRRTGKCSVLPLTSDSVRQKVPRDHAEHDGSHLPDRAREHQRRDRCHGCNRRTLSVRGQGLRHPQHRLRDDRDRDDLQPDQQPRPDRAREQGRAVRKEDHQHRRREREGDERGDRATSPGSTQPDPEPDLARRRPGQELAERDEVGVLPIVQPFPALDDLGTEVSKVRDRPTERRHPEFQEDPEHFPRRPTALRLHVHGPVSHRCRPSG